MSSCESLPLHLFSLVHSLYTTSIVYTLSSISTTLSDVNRRNGHYRCGKATTAAEEEVLSCWIDNWRPNSETTSVQGLPLLPRQESAVVSVLCLQASCATRKANIIVVMSWKVAYHAQIADSMRSSAWSQKASVDGSHTQKGSFSTTLLATLPKMRRIYQVSPFSTTSMSSTTSCHPSDCLMRRNQ
jgi:hypothetical protein